MTWLGDIGNTGRTVLGHRHKEEHQGELEVTELR